MISFKFGKGGTLWIVGFYQVHAIRLNNIHEFPLHALLTNIKFKNSVVRILNMLLTMKSIKAITNINDSTVVTF